MKKLLFFGIFLFPLLLSSCQEKRKKDIIYKSNSYTVYNNRVIQGDYTAIAVSPTEIQTNYRSPSNLTDSPDISFKFSINSRDNELPAGEEHNITLNPVNGKYDSPVIVFGESFSQGTDTIQKQPLPSNTRWIVKVDMNNMLNEFRKQGYYTTPTGDIIDQKDFKGVYIAGGNEPLTWDFENLYSKESMKLSDENNDGIYEGTIIMNPITETSPVLTEWKLTENISGYPQYQSQQMLIDALYNMALDNMVSDIRPDGTLRAGAAWDGVWTRDISYSIYLALAYINPDAAQKSLKAKVKDNRIIQDTGTGGAWPVSSDRVVWSIAAWELYKYTGDQEWLKYAYSVIKNSATEDTYTVRDPHTGLMRGEQSYLDWREQTYPRWMQPIDIYQSLCLGTNAVHYQMYTILGKMADLLDESPQSYQEQAESIKIAMNRYLWMGEKGYYGQYLYGGIYPILSPGIDNLGESLAILFGIVPDEEVSRMVSSIPVGEYGASSIYPQLPNIKPYHNNAVWPFVQSFWNLASAKAGNEKSVIGGLGALYRSAALFATHKELFVASSGDYKGTAVNSDKMLWSLSGNIAMIYRLFFGMQFEPDGIIFAPFIPRSIPGEKHIKNFKYRKAVLNLTIKGTGDEIEDFFIDGKKNDQAFIPADLIGTHEIKIILSNEKIPKQAINLQPTENMPFTTQFEFLPASQSINISNYDGQNTYVAYINGKEQNNFEGKDFKIPEFTGLTKIDIVAINSLGLVGFTGNPFIYIAPENVLNVEVENFATPSRLSYNGYSGRGFVEISKKANTDLSVSVNIKQAGKYYIDVRYANGNGPINTQNKCAIRSLFVNNNPAGPIVMPQRGENEWSNWGYSNPVLTELKPDKNTISLRFIAPQDENMNGEINNAIIDFIRIRKAN